MIMIIFMTSNHISLKEIKYTILKEKSEMKILGDDQEIGAEIILKSKVRGQQKKSK